VSGFLVGNYLYLFQCVIEFGFGDILIVSPNDYKAVHLQHLTQTIMNKSSLPDGVGFTPLQTLQKYFHFICRPQRVQIKSMVSSTAALVISPQIKKRAGESD